MSYNSNDMMSGNAMGFQPIFQTYRFIIPEFQREFEWEKDQISTFIDDILEALDYNHQYFFGPVVFLSQHESQQQEIIDGQQRLTSFSILLALISDIMFEYAEIKNDKILAVASKQIRAIIADENPAGSWTSKITPHTDSILFYQELLSPEKPDKKISDMTPKANSIAKKTMLIAYKLFRSKIKENFLDSKGEYDCAELSDFAHNLGDPKNYVVLQIKLPDQKTAWQVFINLNKKGQDLQTMTMIKAVLLSRIPEIEAPPSTVRPRNIFTQHWNTMLTNLGEKISFDQFLHHYFVAKLKKVSEKKLYDEVSQNYLTRTAAQKLITELVDYSNYYRACVDPNSSDFAETDGELIRSNISSFKKNLGITHAFPILLAGYTNYYISTPQEKPRFKKLLDWTLRFFIRTRTICQEEPTKLEQFSSDICGMIRNGMSEDEIKNFFITKQPNDTYFHANFAEKDKSTVKLDFFILEKINQWGYGETSSDLTSLAQSNRSIEHIMPENLTEDWYEQLKRENKYTQTHDGKNGLTNTQIDQLHNANLNKWGNLAPMNKRNNSSIKNLTFHEKDNFPDKGYKSSNAQILKNIGVDKSDPRNPINHKQEDSTYTEHDPNEPSDWWNFDSIDKRTKTLSKIAEKIFKVT